jgi:hypothetical protein
MGDMHTAYQLKEISWLITFLSKRRKNCYLSLFCKGKFASLPLSMSGRHMSRKTGVILFFN